MAGMTFNQKYATLEPQIEEPRLLADFSKTDLKKIYAIGVLQDFADGEIMVIEWANDSSLFVILEGSAEVLIPKSIGWYKLATIGPAEVFGEFSFFDWQPRSARVVALADCRVLKIDVDAFHRLRELDISLTLSLLQNLGNILSQRLRHMNDLVRTLVK